MYMMCQEIFYSIIYKNIKCKNEFLVMIWNCYHLKKMEHWIYKESTHSQKFINLFKKDKLKKCHVLGYL